MLNYIRRQKAEGNINGGEKVRGKYKTLVGVALAGILALSPTTVQAEEGTETQNSGISQQETRQESKQEQESKTRETGVEESVKRGGLESKVGVESVKGGKEGRRNLPQTIQLAEVAKNINIEVEDSDTKKQVLGNLLDYFESKEGEVKVKELTDEEVKKQLEDELKVLKEEWTESLRSLTNEDTQTLLQAGITIKGNTEAVDNHATILEQVGYLQEDANIYLYVLNGPALLDDGLFDLLEEVLTKEANLVVLGTKEQAEGLDTIFGDSKWYTFIQTKEEVTVTDFTGIMNKAISAYKDFNDNPIVTKHLPKNNRVYQDVRFATYPTVPNQSSFNYGFDDPAYEALLGNTHRGVDISYTTSVRDIYTVDKGVVTKVNTGCAEGLRDCGGGYGNYIEISHPHLSGSMKTLYAHLESVDVVEGQAVKAGQYIGEMGNTGRSDGNHLHFEVFSKNTKVNPVYYVNFDTYR